MMTELRWTALAAIAGIYLAAWYAIAPPARAPRSQAPIVRVAPAAQIRVRTRSS